MTKMYFRSYVPAFVSYVIPNDIVSLVISENSDILVCLLKIVKIVIVFNYCPEFCCEINPRLHALPIVTSFCVKILTTLCFGLCSPGQRERGVREMSPERLQHLQGHPRAQGQDHRPQVRSRRFSLMTLRFILNHTVHSNGSPDARTCIS